MNPRVEYYSKIIRDALEEAERNASIPRRLTSRVIQEGVRQATSRDWEDNNQLRFTFRINTTNEESLSDQAAECLSDREEESLVQETQDEFRSLFGTTQPRQTPLTSTRNFLSKLYRIVRHPRQRPVFKSLLRQLFTNNQRLFKQAWKSLLYLTRIFYAALTFVDLATRSDLECIQLRHIPAHTASRLKNPENRSPIEVLTSLGSPPPSQQWRDFFQSREKVQQFIRLSGSKKAVHGEVQLILHVDSQNLAHEGLTGRVFPYIGCSKRCCFFCDLFRKVHGTFQARGTHQTLFPLWGLPEELLQHSLPVLRQLLELLRGTLRRMLAAWSYPPPRRDLLEQSSAALSTAQAMQNEAPTYSIHPQTSR